MTFYELWKDRTDQRTVEYPFLFENLPYLHSVPQDPKPKLLDVGCVESELTLKLAELGKYDVFAIDIRDYDTKELPIKFVKGDIRNPLFPKNFFDIIIAISTIEHIGLDWYDNKWMDKNGDVEAMHAIQRILKPSGVLIMSVDAGKLGTKWFRAYNQHNINRLVAGWNVVKMKWFEKVNVVKLPWVTCSAARASFRRSEEYADACVCMVLRKD